MDARHHICICYVMHMEFTGYHYGLMSRSNALAAQVHRGYHIPISYSSAFPCCGIWKFELQFQICQLNKYSFYTLLRNSVIVRLKCVTPCEHVFRSRWLGNGYMAIYDSYLDLSDVDKTSLKGPYCCMRGGSLSRTWSGLETCGCFRMTAFLCLYSVQSVENVFFLSHKWHQRLSLTSSIYARHWRDNVVASPWTSYQIRKFVRCPYTGMPGTFFLPPTSKETAS